MPKKVTIYTTPYCPHCTRAKALLKSKNVAFQEIDVSEDTTKREEVSRRTGWQTVPMIFIGEEFVGGAEDLYTLEEKGQLDPKLK